LWTTPQGTTGGLDSENPKDSYINNATEEVTMAIEDLNEAVANEGMSIDFSPNRERLLKLVRETKRYSIGEREPGRFGLYDGLA
jgi:hypothetical protein